MEVNEMKEKKAWQEYADAAIGLGCLVGAGVLSYALGKKIERLECARSLNRVCIIHPEIEDLIKDSVKKLNEKS